MSKILFIRTKSTPQIKEGGELLTDRNFTILQKIFGKENIEKVEISNDIGKKYSFKKIKQFFLILKGYAGGLHPKIVMSICENANNFDTIFIDRSIFGIIAKKLRESAYKGKIITHFHNVESMFFKTRLSPYSIYKPFYIHCVLRNDMWGLRYSDKTIVLNQRDKDLLHYFFEIMPTNIIPITLPDELKEADFDKGAKISEKLKCLFIGANNAANVKGIKWFVKNVLPFVDVKMQIVGKGLSFLREKKTFRKIDILSDISDISTLIHNADVLIMPIFDSSGMKVKTCSALMYGKNILGTDEAFEGYNLDFEKIGGKCNTANMFIEAIKNFSKYKQLKHNEYSRSLYKNNYTDSVAECLLDEMITS